MKIVCFGDSNTWGYIPLEAKRYKDRWTKVLASMLEEDEIVEEGLNSRTIYSYDEKEPWKRAITYIRPCLESHDPIDIFVLMIGTNELKNRFCNSAEDILCYLKELVNEIVNFKYHYDHNIKLIISGIPPVNDEIRVFSDYENTKDLRNKYNMLVKKYCMEENITFIDNSDLEVGLDGVHLTAESHMKLALKLYSTIKGE